MPKAEWRLFLPSEEGDRPPSAAKPLTGLLDNVEPAVRTDVYIKANSDNGVKQRGGGGGLELKTLQERKSLGGGVGPGIAETFRKISLGDNASVMHVIEYLRMNGGISEELESTIYDPVEVRVTKAVRKDTLKVGEGKVRFEFTEVTVSSAGMPEDYPQKWLTFCAEGTVEEIETFIGSEEGKPLVPLMSLRGALQVGYPQFVQMISS